MSLSACVDSFILALLCGNPILKGAFVTSLNGIVLTLDEEISVLTAELGRLNLVNEILSLEIQAVQATVDKVQADLNLILAPLAAYGTCPELAQLNEKLQNSGVGKTFSSLQKKLYEFNRTANLVVIQAGIIKQKQKLRQTALDIIDRINILCP